MTLGHYAECRRAECRILFIVMLSAIMLSVIMLSVVVPPTLLWVDHTCAPLGAYQPLQSL
jgi:hypothetical protein